VLADYRQSERQFYNGKFITPYGCQWRNHQRGVLQRHHGQLFGNDANGLQRAAVKGSEHVARTSVHRPLHVVGALVHNGGYAVDQERRMVRRPEPSQVFVLNAVYQLPFGKGKMYGANTIHGLSSVDADPIAAQLSAGLPFTPTYSECGSDNDVAFLLSIERQLVSVVMGGNSFNSQTLA
jgi:hypothetical protein